MPTDGDNPAELLGLYRAIAARDAAAIRQAVREGADPSSPEVMESARGGRSTPLGEAMRTGDLKVVEAVLKAGATPNEDDFLRDCITEGDARLARLLLKYGAEPDGFPDEDETREAYQTPLILAAHEGRHAVAKALLEAGADPDKHDANDESALLIARLNKDRRMATLIEPFVSEAERAWVEERLGPAYAARLELDARIRAAIHTGDENRTAGVEKGTFYFSPPVSVIGGLAAGFLKGG